MDGSLVVSGALGIGNSSPGSTLGTVVRRIPSFDSDGTPLGYLPVYGAIS